MGAFRYFHVKTFSIHLRATLSSPTSTASASTSVLFLTRKRSLSILTVSPIPKMSKTWSSPLIFFSKATLSHSLVFTMFPSGHSSALPFLLFSLPGPLISLQVPNLQLLSEESSLFRNVGPGSRARRLLWAESAQLRDVPCDGDLSKAVDLVAGADVSGGQCRDVRHHHVR